MGAVDGAVADGGSGLTTGIDLYCTDGRQLDSFVFSHGSTWSGL